MRTWLSAFSLFAVAAIAAAGFPRVVPVARSKSTPVPKFSEELLRYSESVSASYSYRFGAKAPFAPSNARSVGDTFIPPSAFPSAEYCGHCHAAAYAQWKESLHRNSFREPFYTRNVALLTTGKGIEYTRHCEACHNPIALFSGALTPASKVTRGFDDAGVTCSVCHSIVGLQQPTVGNGSYVIGIPAVMTDAAGNRIPGIVPDAAISAHPERHVRAVMQPFYRGAEYCGTCHKSTVPTVLSGYKWLTGFNTYDEWDASAYSHRSPLTFYQKPQAVCQSCHMPPETAGAGEAAAKNGLIASHRWLAGNTAVPYYFGAGDQVEQTAEFFAQQRLQLQVFSLSTAPAGGGPAPLIPAPTPLQPGNVVQALVLVSNTGLGHSLIPEQRDIYEAWLEFTAVTADGTVIWKSGAILPAGQLDPAAHSFTNRLIAPDGTPLLEHQIWLRRAVAFDNTVASGQTALARYEFRLPGRAALPIQVTVRLRYRHFNQHYVDFALGPGHTDYPVVTMATAAAAFSATGLAAAPRGWKDWNNLGIALLAQADYPEAKAAFGQVLELQPGYADGMTNAAIAELGLDHFDQAKAEAGRALVAAQAAKDEKAAARAFYYRGVIERNLDGDLMNSESDLQAAARMYPKSRQALHQLGVAEYLTGQSTPARGTFAALLANDPYDLLGHYYLAVLERRAGMAPEALAQSAMYEDEKPRAGEAAVALMYLRGHPEVRPESVADHIHMQPGLMASMPNGMANDQ